MNKEKSNAGSVLDQLQSLEKKIDILLRLAYKMSDQAYKDLSISEKEMLTFNEATEYLGISPSLLYKMTASWTIPHYKPRGKMIYFSKKGVGTIHERRENRSIYINLHEKRQ